MGQLRACLAAAVVLLCAAPLVAGARQCFTTIESSSPMFGAPWKKTYVTYSQETQWKRHGDMVKLNLYYDEDKNCLVGVKPTFGSVNSMAMRLGTEKTAEKKPVSSKHILLGSQEKIVSAHWKAGRCIEYIKLSTNQGRYLEIGHKDSAAHLRTNKPAAGAFLGFFKGFTDVINTNAATGSIQQLQLFWCLRECEEPNSKVISESGHKAKKKLAHGMTEEGETSSTEGGTGTTIVELVTVGVNAPDGIVDSNTTTSTTTETIIVTDGAAEDQDGSSSSSNGTAAAGSSGSGDEYSSSSSNSTEGEDGSSGSLTIKGHKGRFNAFLKMKADRAGSNYSEGANCSLTTNCPNGACPTPSCALNGAGKDVLTMMCYGTNIIPNPLLDVTIGNPCTNLACKLDNTNCSSGPLGLGGFCTGKVVTMGSTAKLHPAGKAWIGYPCIEHKGPLLSLLPPVHGDYDAGGVYVSKAWKVCDCINGLGFKRDSFSVDLPDPLESKLNETVEFVNGFLETKVTKLKLSPVVEKVTELIDGITEALSMFELSLTIPLKDKIPLEDMLPEITVNVTELPVMKQGILGMSVPEVVSQWATAFATKAALKKYIVSQSKLHALRAFVPGFEVPSVLVANISAPLMKKAKFDLPVFTIPDEALSSVALLLPNITSLPSVCVPKVMTAAALMNATGGIAGLTLHNVTIPSMERVVERLLSIFPPPEWAVSIISGKFAEVANKWITGVLVDEPVPTVNVTSSQWAALCSLLPGLDSANGTTLVLWNASSLLFTKPRLTLMDQLNTITIPDELSFNVSSICPLLSPGLPALLVPPGAEDGSNTTSLTLGAIAPPDLKITIDKLIGNMHSSSGFNITLPGGSILNITLPLPKLGHMFAAGLDGMINGRGMESVLDAFAGFEAMKKNLTGLAAMKNVSMDLADQAFVKLVGGNFTGIKLMPGNFSLEELAAAKTKKTDEGLNLLKNLLGPKIAVLKAAKKHKAKVLNITMSP